MTDLDCAAKAVSALLEMGSDCVVLTLGDKGLLYSQQLRDREGAGGITWDNSGYIPAEKVDVVDTTVSAGGGGQPPLASYVKLAQLAWSRLFN